MKNIEISPRHPLFSVAMCNRQGMTKKDATTEVKKLGLSPINQHVAALTGKIEALRFLKEVASFNRLAKHIGYARVAGFSIKGNVYSRLYAHGTPAKAKKIDSRPLADRLASYKRKKAWQNAPDFRFDTNPEYRFTSNPAEVGVYQTDYLDWDYYSNKYPKKVVNTSFVLPVDWSARVLAKGLADLGGMYTLDASPLQAPSGMQLFAATWVSQGRGYALEEHKGYIALSGDTEYHGATAEKAVAGLERKLKSKGLTAELSSLVSNLTETAQKHPHLTVSVSDAKSAGACDYGIKSWCNRVGITTDVVSIAKMAEAYAQAPAEYARAAVLVAIKRQRKSIAI